MVCSKSDRFIFNTCFLQFILILGPSACSDSKSGEDSSDTDINPNSSYNDPSNVNIENDPNKNSDLDNNGDDNQVSSNDQNISGDNNSSGKDTGSAKDSDPITNTPGTTTDESETGTGNGADTNNDDTGSTTDVTETGDDAGTSPENTDGGEDTEEIVDETENDVPPIDLIDCDSSEASIGVDCGTYETLDGTVIQLGPYGAHVDENVGEGFETDVALGDRTTLMCRTFAGTFEAPEEETDRLLDTGDLDFALHSVYHPAYYKEGEKYPLLVWGNGTCAMPEGYGALLRYVASYGFFVVAPNSRWVGGNDAMPIALDFMFDANEDSSSPYYQKIDTEKVGAMGHSQGGQATGTTSTNDARVKVAILFNGGSTDAKPFLTVSGDRDIGDPSVSSYEDTVKSASKPAAFLFYHKVPEGGSMTGHLTLMKEPERVTEPTMHWFNYMLNKDEESSKWFLGNDCKLCNRDEDFEYGQKGLPAI